MTFLKKAAFCYVAPLLSIFSVATTPLEAQCCDPSPCCMDWSSLLVPALVGAAAGAATAAAIKNKGKHGKKGERGCHGEQGERGRRGPAGENPFIRDVENSLTFNFELESITGVESVDGPITPYISTPEGRIITGTPFNFSNTSSSTDTGITIGSPVFGTYTFGFEVSGHSSEVVIEYDVRISTTDDRGTTEYEGSATLAPENDLVQLNWDYTYGPYGTVPTEDSSSSSSS